MKTINALFITHKDIDRFKSIFGSVEYHEKDSKSWKINNCTFKNRSLCYDNGGEYCPCKSHRKLLFGCYHYNPEIETILKNNKIRYHKVTFNCTRTDHINMYYIDNTKTINDCNLSNEHKQASKYFKYNSVYEDCENCPILIDYLEKEKCKNSDIYNTLMNCFSRTIDTNVKKYDALHTCYLIVDRILESSELEKNYFIQGYDFWYLKDKFTIFRVYGHDIPLCIIGRIYIPNPIKYLIDNNIKGHLINDFRNVYQG